MSNNDCLKNEIIQEYLDKQLSSEKMTKIAAHLENCHSCRIELEKLQKVFGAADRFAVKSLNVPVNTFAIEGVMNKIQRKSISAQTKEPSISQNSHNYFSMFKWILVPCIGIALLLFMLSNGIVEKRHFPASEKEFSMSENSTEILLGKPGEKLVVNGKEMKLSELVNVPMGQMVELPPDALLLVRVGNHRFKFSHSAVFACTNKEVIIVSGNVSADLSGDHAGLNVKSPAVTVTPLGTSFDLEVRNWGTKVVLKSGKLELVSIRGVKKSVVSPETIYTSMDGNFSKEIPQPKVSPNSQFNNAHPETNPGSQNNGSDSPKTLIDSF